MRCVEDQAVAAAIIGVELPLALGSSVATRMDLLAALRGRNSICTSRSCVGLRTEEADIREGIAHRATADLVECRVIRGRHPASVEAAGLPAAEVTLVAAAGVTRAAAVTLAVVGIPAVVDIPVIDRLVTS